VTKLVDDHLFLASVR